MMSHIDLDAFFDDLPDNMSLGGSDAFNTLSPPSIDGIENILMKDGDELFPLETDEEASDSFFAGLLVDPYSDLSGEAVQGSSDKDSDPSNSGRAGMCEKQSDAVDVVNNSMTADDPISKKQDRQLRNRYAAVRSRERKKIYVKDLERKSKFFEGECLRLGRLLQCLMAENQALRFSLQSRNAYGASMAKQESAVLLLESLLLGSLFWSLCIMCLSTLPELPFLLTLEMENAGRKDHPTQAPKGARNETGGSNRSVPFFREGRRCIASKTKMKLELPFPHRLLLHHLVSPCFLQS
ncbi:hypothetical protein SAY86_016181 [Trapa natans]|uniref:BZIP domain-containing protein n=1 Tax=Trapa natans TaxID=22666 RepID=A0AAN7LCM4_TRANT|nr:hypothetical protein SAY86_016181 [Trapa natans]